MTSVATNQLTLDFEPALPERFNTLRAYIGHRVQVQAKPAKTIAADMDMSPSTLSRKLNPGESDTQRFNCDDLELYIRTTHDTGPIEYLIAKYMQSDASRLARALSRVEALSAEWQGAVQVLKGLSEASSTQRD